MPRYKDTVGENPTADADIQVVASYLNYIIIAGINSTNRINCIER